jgi:hypothetical protein
MTKMSWRSPSTTDGPGKRGAQTVEVATYQARLTLLRNLSPRLVRLSVALAIGIAALWLVPSLSHDAEPQAALRAAASIAPAASPEASQPPVPPDRATYWIGAHEIEGVVPELAPGTRVEVWVTWEPPLVKQPVVEKLIRDAYIAAILPSTMIEGTLDVGLSLNDRDISAMTYGERFGSLNLIVLNG